MLAHGGNQGPPGNFGRYAADLEGPARAPTPGGVTPPAGAGTSGSGPRSGPGSPRARLANTTAPSATAVMAGIGTVGCGTAEMPPANRDPQPPPQGDPDRDAAGQPTPTRAATEDCHATDAAICRWVNPSALRRANCRRRWRTDATSVRPSAPMAPTARTPAKRAGVVPATVRVIGDLGRAETADHAADRPVRGPVEHRSDVVERAQGHGVARAGRHGDQHGHGTGDRAALLIEVAGREQ